MKRLLLLIALSISVIAVSAQYCGNSGPGICTPSNAVTQPGLSPLPDSLPPFINGVNASTTIQFKNFDTVFLGGGAYVLQSLRVDSIGNLPAGLCWAANVTNNTFSNSQNGCILVSGTPCDTPGQYKLKILATVGVGGFYISVDANDYGLQYIVRLNNYGEATVAVDSTQPATTPLIPYGPAAVCTLPLTVSLGADQSLCNGSVAAPTPVINGGHTPYTYAWQSVGDNLSCNNCSSPTVTLSQNSHYILVVTDANNSTVTDTIYYTVIGSGANFQVSAGGPTSFCRGGTVTLSGVFAAGLGYQWLRNGNNIANATSNTYAVTDSSGAYSVYFSTSSNCHANSNVINVTVSDYPPATITWSGPLAFCQGDSLVLNAYLSNGLTYQWQRNAINIVNTSPSYVANTSGSYRVIETSGGLCSDTSSVTAITVNPLPNVSFALSPDTVCIFGGVVTITGGSPAGGTYSGTGVSGTSFNPTTSGVGQHTLQYSYTDNNSCNNSVTQTVTILNCVTGIADIDAEKAITIYPNPAHGDLTIESEIFAAGNIVPVVYDVTGKQIELSYAKQVNRFVFNTTQLAPGIYWVKVHVNGSDISKKFTKE